MKQKQKLVDLSEIEYFVLKDNFGVPRYRIEIGENIPTVEAIRVDWIREYCRKKAAADLMGCYGRLYEEYTLKMIDEWRKENEL